MTTLFLPVEQTLTITQPADSAGSYRRLSSPGGAKFSPVAMIAAVAVTLGPYDEPRYYEVLSDYGDATYSYALAHGSLPPGKQDDIDAKKVIAVVANVGTAATGFTAVERGDDFRHVTTLTASSTLGDIAGGADLGLGKLAYTFPAGAIVIDKAYINMSITQSEGNITADTPEVGLGSVIASGVVAVLSGTATFEDILTGQVAADCNGTATVKTVANQQLVIESGDAHTVHFNVADGWAASGDEAAAIAGTIVLHWHFME